MNAPREAGRLRNTRHNWKRQYIPQQHGAWAMLLLPFLFGMLAAEAAWPHALLFVAWLFAYLFAFAMLQIVRTRKFALYGRPVLLYGVLLLTVCGWLLVLQPGLIRLALLFLPMLLVHLVYARRNQERALVNDLAAVVQFSLIIFVIVHMGGGGNRELAFTLFLWSVLYFAGTVFYVKSIIRERHNPKYYGLSVGYHLVLVAAGLLWVPASLWLPLFVLLARAVWTPRTNLSIKHSGMLEIAYSAMAAVAVIIVFAS